MTLNQDHLLDWIKVGLGFLALGSVVVGFLAYLENRRRERDKEISGQVQKSFQWAYDVLTDGGRMVPPLADRLNWLTSARHLLRAQRLSSFIVHPTYRIIQDESEEYWRHRFYVALSHANLRQWAYFGEPNNPTWPENIEINSALVVVQFSNWKEGVSDPASNVNREELTRTGGLGGNAGRGLAPYIERLTELKAKRQIQ